MVRVLLPGLERLVVVVWVGQLGTRKRREGGWKECRLAGGWGVRVHSAGR